MVRSAGGKRVTRDMTKATVKSHLATPAGRHATSLKVPAAPRVGAKAGKAPKTG